MVHRRFENSALGEDPLGVEVAALQEQLPDGRRGVDGERVVSHAKREHGLRRTRRWTRCGGCSRRASATAASGQSEQNTRQPYMLPY